MSMEIILAAVIVGGTGLLLGLFLGLAGKKFAVEIDEKEQQVREQLPGNNCGGCGYAGCDAMAKAIANGEAPVNGCPVGGDAVAAKIARIMGQEAGESIRRVAFVKCGGTCDKAKESCHYYGVHDCEMMDFIPGGGPKTLSLIHISEPTRRTPISYAVFCLKKKKQRIYSTKLDWRQKTR